MGKRTMNQKGFGAIEAVLIFVIIGIIGGASWYVVKANKNVDKTNAQTASNSSTTPSKTTKKMTPTALTQVQTGKDPYAGWKTYTSVLNSGLSFKYPADWVFTPAKQTPSPNNLGGVENDSVLRSTAIQGGYGTVSNQYMCVTIDEYSAKGWDFPSNWTLGKELSSEQVSLGSSSATLSTYAGDTPMRSELILHSSSSTTGNHFVNTMNGFVVSVKASFNSCQQPAGGQGITNQQADFTKQPETDVAKNIIKSIQY